MPRTLLRVLFVLGSLGACYFGWGYYRIESYVQRKEKIPAWPAPFETTKEVIDVGYILEVYTTRDFWKGEKRIIWYVKVPKTDKIYVCDWGFGFSGFARNDSVRLIHESDLEQIDEGGQLIGLRGQLQGKIANVAVNDKDVLLSVN